MNENRAPVRFPIPASVEEWVARLRSGSTTTEECEAFEAWLAEDDRRRDDYARCLRLDSLPQAVQQHPDLMASLAGRLETLREARRSGSTPRGRRTWLPLAMAAAVCLVVIAAVIGIEANSFVDPGDALTAATRRGEQRPVALADGSRVELNTDSSMTWELTPNERRVVLERGEAFFDVAKDPSRPFVVRVGKSEIRVVGTQFSVRRDGERFEVVVKEGRVNVVPDARPIERLLSTKIELTPGNRMLMADAKDLVQVTAVNPERLTAWRTGSLEFDGMTLDQVVAELNRYTDKPLVIADPGIRDQRISGRIRVGDMDTLRFLLRERFDIVAHDGQDAVRLSRAQ